MDSGRVNHVLSKSGGIVTAILVKLEAEGPLRFRVGD